MPIRSNIHPCLFLVLLLACKEQEPLEPPPWSLPEVAAESEYIEYSTWADDSVLCMDERLAELDRYIEETAAYLGVSPPAQKIRYVWVPRELKDSETWACNDPTFFLWGCLKPWNAKAYVFSEFLGNYHELVHAVTTSALGPAHRVLEEGLADYLSEGLSTASQVEGFPEAFTAMVERGGRPDYRLAMHFVGSLVEADGIAKYMELHRTMEPGVGLAEFAAAFRAVYGEELVDALERMDAPIEGRLAYRCEGELLPWGDTQDLEATVVGRCGDGLFHGGGFLDERAGFHKPYVLDIPVYGLYTLSLTAGGEPALADATLTNCRGAKPGVTSVAQGASAAPGLLHPGRHKLMVGFPQSETPEGELELKLTYEPPPP